MIVVVILGLNYRIRRQLRHLFEIGFRQLLPGIRMLIFLPTFVKFREQLLILTV